MNTIRTAIETFIRLVQAEVLPDAVLVAPDDSFEVKRTPSLLLQGPTLVENAARRTQARLIQKDTASFSYEECRHPRLYHLDFDLILTTDTEVELLEIGERVARFFQLFPVLPIGQEGTLNLTELVPLGGLRRVNLSNLRQASGRLRVEDCPVYDGRTVQGKLIRDRTFVFQGQSPTELSETRTFTPQGVTQ
jgi:hypothetical protein